MIQDVLNNISTEESPVEDNPLLLVHYNHNEAIWSDIIQKTPHGHFDKETGLRSYEPLGKMLQDPEFSTQLEEVFKLAHAKTGEPKFIGDELENAGIDMAANYKFNPAPGDSLPEVQELSKLGKQGDDVIVLMPKNLMEFLAHQKGRLSINPNTGFPQFFLGKVLGMVGAGLAAAAATTPLGAAALGALGGASGSFLGSHLEGKGGRHAGKSALIGGLGGGILGGLGHYFGILPPGQVLGAGAAEHGAQQMAAQQIAQQQAQETAKNAASSGFDWSNLGKIMAVGSIIPQFMGARQDEKAIKRERERVEREESERRKEISRLNESLMGPPMSEEVYGPPSRKVNPDLQLDHPDFYKGGRSHHWFAKYNKGGQVKSPVRYLREKRGGMIDGHEKGQEDNVYTSTPAGTFILDASVTSDIGDGNTNAGKKIWQKFINQYTKNAPEIKTNPVKVALSAGEMLFPAKGVSALGGGSIEQGGHILQQMVNRIRQHKASHGSELPPPALPLHQYLRGMK